MHLRKSVSKHIASCTLYLIFLWQIVCFNSWTECGKWPRISVGYKRHTSKRTEVVVYYSYTTALSEAHKYPELHLRVIWADGAVSKVGWIAAAVVDPGHSTGSNQSDRLLHGHSIIYCTTHSTPELQKSVPMIICKATRFLASYIPLPGW